METSVLLQDSFRRNGEVNAALLDHLIDADLTLADGQGGLSIGQHLEHLVGVRRYWLGRVAPASVERLHYITLEGDNRFWDLTLDLPTLKAAFEESDAVALEAVQNAYKEGRKFSGVYESDPAHFLQHMLVHDSHHRGQIMTLLRQCGRSLEQMDALEQATWPIWKR